MPTGIGLNEQMLKQMSYPNLSDLMGGSGGGGGNPMQQMGGGMGGGQMQQMMQQMMQGGGGMSQFTMGGVDAYAQQGQAMPSFGNHGPMPDGGILNPAMHMFTEKPEFDPLAPYEPPQTPQQQPQQMPGMAGGFRMPGAGGP